MDLRLYDSKAAAVVPFEPLKEGEVSIYLCGPTVQGSPHIGHLRAAASFDVLIRWLERQGVDVTYVRNVTDIDDKILARAEETGMEWWAVAQKYEREFQDAYKTLGLKEPTIEPRATGHIPDQIELVERLIERGHAYTDGEGSVYFDVFSQPDYGSLTHQSPNDMLDSQDGDNAAGKKDPRDFALWKARKEGEPETASWPSPWGKGRPAWHLECSAMSHRYLGEAFDIHGGGIDLRFPHHENEQAQSHGAGWDFANLWVHNAWVTTKGEKMSKSIGNTLALESLLEQASAAVIRFALSSVHHRSAIEWGPETLTQAQANWEKIARFVLEAGALVGQPESVFLGPEDLPSDFVEAMNADLNVSKALAVVHAHVKAGRAAMLALDRGGVERELLLVRSMMDVLGLDPASKVWMAEQPFHSTELADEQAAVAATLLEVILGIREAVRRQHDWGESDRIRDRLAAAGIVVEDRPGGVTWTPKERREHLERLAKAWEILSEPKPGDEGPAVKELEGGGETNEG